MIKAIGIILTLNIPFLLASAVLFYFAFTADEKALTGDGYNLKNSLFMWGGVVLGMLSIINAFTIRWMVKKRRQIKDMLTYGKRGTAKIVKMEDTGVTINDNPRVKLQLEISIPDYPSYFAQKTLVIPLINLPQVQPGLLVDILADPNDKYNEDRIGLIMK